MIPVRLQLKNFMSYGESVPPLEFAGMRLACLSGDNGNGKTAILDAITWTLWGETRAPSEDEVIRLGASECRVLLDFVVQGVKYRAHRARTRRGGSIWELQIWQEDGSLRALSGTNARETKQKIENLLRMDYKTFLASAYLAQGRADEFTRASVAERKKVLADILDLSRYEWLEQAAKDRRADADRRQVDAERSIQGIDAELAHEHEHRDALTAAGERLSALMGVIEAGQKEYDDRSALCQRLGEREEKAREYEARIHEVQAEIAENTKHLGATEARITLAEQVLARRGEIEAAYKTASDLKLRIAALEAQDSEVRKLEREARALEREIETERDALDRERYRLDCEVQALEQEGRDIPRWDAEVQRLAEEMAAYRDPEARRQETEARREQVEEELAQLKGQHEAIRQQIERLGKRVAALASSDAPLCDWCGQPLSPAKREQAREEAEAERDSLKAELKDVAGRGSTLTARRERLRQETERAQADLREVARLSERRAQATQEGVRLAKRCEALPARRESLAALMQRLEQRDYALEAQERLMKISARLEKLERVEQALEDARARMERLVNAERDFRQLEGAEEKAATEVQHAEQYRAAIAKREMQIAKAEKLIADIRTETATLPTLERERAALAVELQTSRAAAQDAQHEIGERTSLLKRCATLKEQRVRWQQEREQAAKDKNAYTELAAAFGKKGVQALIIENALPEIQDVANQMLGRMTDGAMQVQLLTQREARTKGAGAIETLDIIISDDMGTRPYEMYSGGEAFRINFALRIALSKMLARRAGAPLQTLILDEGFGTQDPRGREALADALHTVSEDFALVLVITHIEELKEAFPTRIEVVKGQAGSTFTVA